jgi:DNA mismatch repair protein MutS
MEKLTPMMKQYFDIKENYPDTLLFYRLGDFYELFFDDARIVSKECDLVLTSRSKEVEKAPMCGVPHHSVTPYLQKLLNRGYKVAIVEQTEDPATAKGIVKREVVRIVTPGTMIDEMDDDRSTVNLASIEDAHYGIAIAIVEIASGKSKVIWAPPSPTKVLQILLKNNVKEIIVSNGISSKFSEDLVSNHGLVITTHNDTSIIETYSRLIDDTFNDTTKTAIKRLINYLQKTQFSHLSHLKAFEQQEKNIVCELDYTTINNLDLIYPSKNNKQQLTLWSYLDKCKSAMGSRLLKQWIVEPLQEETKIMTRQNKVTELVKEFLLRDDLRKQLQEVYDLERITTKIAFKRAMPTDLVQLRKTLSASQKMQELLTTSNEFSYWDDVNTCYEINEMLSEALLEQPPVSIKEGNIFKKGYNEELDYLNSIHTQGKDWLISFENREKEKTKIKNLKIGYNRVFGYFIEVSKGNTSLIKDEFGYIRKQTLVNAERYISQELKEKEDELLHAKEKANKLEEFLFERLIENLQHHILVLQTLSDELATLDVLCALAEISSQKGYTAPKFNQNNVITIKSSIHPLLEKIAKNQKVVANDWIANDSKSVFVLTGPNMGGKSTYMRQIALLVIMAQIGCYVLAKEADIPIFDAIFTRIGASDDILSGQSTFMVEMVEANAALSSATEKSLILFDEIGRGTSTYDGMALAQAIIEYVDTVIHAKTIFSTHYHELTSLEGKLNHVENIVTQVIEKDGEVTFLYRIKKGKADKSYGINVAHIAKLPSAVIHRAKDLLKQLETNRKHVQQSMDIVEMKVIPKPLQAISDQLKSIVIEEMTPLQAMQCLSDLVDEAKKVK